MLSEPVISLKDVGKCYQIYDQPRDRLLQMFYRGRKKLFQEFWALKGISLDIYPGDVVGIVGRNGSGKSTLLQIVCNTLTPSEGDVTVKGRIAALLELGAGFNPEFTGRENVYLSAMISGMTQAEVANKFDIIVEFSGIGQFIDQPVKTYSSGMYVRLAFSIAIHVEPDILVIDEALSVGDGEFARKSFDRIMELKDAGKTILFCSHALYQVEVLCNRVLWLERGKLVQLGKPSTVVSAYGESIQLPEQVKQAVAPVVKAAVEITSASATVVARISKVRVTTDTATPDSLHIISGVNSLEIYLEYQKTATLPEPNVGICLVRHDGLMMASTATHIDGCRPEQTPTGGRIGIKFPQFSLLRGVYQVDVYLMCERGIHVYDCVLRAAQLTVEHVTCELGVVSLAHQWQHCQ